MKVLEDFMRRRTRAPRAPYKFLTNVCAKWLFLAFSCISTISVCFLLNLMIPLKLTESDKMYSIKAICFDCMDIKVDYDRPTATVILISTWNIEAIVRKSIVPDIRPDKQSDNARVYGFPLSSLGPSRPPPSRPHDERGSGVSFPLGVGRSDSSRACKDLSSYNFMVRK